MPNGVIYVSSKSQIRTKDPLRDKGIGWHREAQAAEGFHSNANYDCDSECALYLSFYEQYHHFLPTTLSYPIRK